METDSVNVKKDLKRIRYWVNRFVRPPVDAESLTIDLWLKAWSKGEKEIPIQTIRNFCYDTLRKLRTERSWISSLSMGWVCKTNNVSNTGTERDQNDFLNSLVQRAKLSPSEVSALYYRFYRSLTLYETARIMGKTQGEVTTIIENALSRLRVVGRGLV